MKKIALLLLFLAACGAPSERCTSEYPNETPEGLCCDSAWQWCLDADGRKVGAP